MRRTSKTPISSSGILIRKKDGLSDHSYMTLKKIRKAIHKLESRVNNTEDSAGTDELEATGEVEDLKEHLRYIYDSAKFMLEADKMIEGRSDFDYDAERSILLVEFM